MSAPVTDVRERYLADFARLEQRLNGQRGGSLHALRQAAIERFAELGFPTTRDEEWRYTNVAALARGSFRLPNGAGTLVTPLLEGLASEYGESAYAARLVFVDGRWSPELSAVGSLPQGVRAGSLSAALAETPELLEPHLGKYAGFADHPFVALNTAFFQDGAFLHVPRGAAVEQPILLLFLATSPDGAESLVTHPRSLIVAGESSQATVVEVYAGQGGRGHWTNAVTEVVTCPGSSIDHYRLQQEHLRAFHVATLQVQQERDSVFSSHAFALGGGLARTDVNAFLDGEGIECTLNGLYLGAGEQVIDNHTRIDHARAHCASHELYKGILDDRSRGVFNGKIFVHQDAQKTDAKQTNNALLLSEDAEIDTKPQLEIYADDVRCTHGATIGQLDPDALFYLRSRGIEREAARNLLTYAFASEIVERVRVDALRERLEKLVLARLGGSQR